MKSELRKTFKSISSSKVAGPGGVPVELLKLLKNLQWKLCIWHEVKLGKLTCGQRTGKVSRLYLFSNRVIHKTNNFRTVALVSRASKTLLKIILEQLQPKLQAEIVVEPAGFRSGRETRNQTTHIRKLMERAGEFKQAPYLCLTDFHKAFDCVARVELWQCMSSIGFPLHPIDFLKTTYRGQKTIVKFETLISE